MSGQVNNLLLTFNPTYQQQSYLSSYPLVKSAEECEDSLVLETTLDSNQIEQLKIDILNNIIVPVTS